MSFPLVSVIVPVYNTDKYVAFCLDSVIRQTYKNIEIIVIDDGSNDLSGSIIDEYAKQDDRIIVIHKQNEGVSATRNKGIDMAKGDYLTFVDSDDLISEQFIEEAIDIITCYHPDIIQGNTCLFVSESNKINDLSYNRANEKPVTDNALLISDISLVKKKVLGNGKEKKNPLNGVFTSGPVCKLYNTKIVAKHRFKKELNNGEDAFFLLEVLDDVSSYVYVDTDWYYYRLNDTSATRRYNPTIANDLSRLLQQLQTIDYINTQDYAVYIQERMIQSLKSVLSSYVLHSNNRIRFKEKIMMVDGIIRKSPWQDIARRSSGKHLPGNLYDKIMLWFCRNTMSFAICILGRIRMILQKIRN